MMTATMRVKTKSNKHRFSTIVYLQSMVDIYSYRQKMVTYTEMHVVINQILIDAN